MRSEGENCFQRAAAVAQNSVLGTGGAAHRRSGEEGFVDHGHHALFDLKQFDSVGGYDDTLSHNEDAEFDIRLTRAGGRIWLTRAIEVTYFPRSHPLALYRQIRELWPWTGAHALATPDAPEGAPVPAGLRLTDGSRCRRVAVDSVRARARSVVVRLLPSVRRRAWSSTKTALRVRLGHCRDDHPSRLVDRVLVGGGFRREKTARDDTDMSASPLVSVIMANFNGVRYLGGAIRSLMKQTMSSLGADRRRRCLDRRQRGAGSRRHERRSAREDHSARARIAGREPHATRR